MYQLHNFDQETFLRDYWQKKPLVIKQGFRDFIDPLDENELAGLALEDSVDSRLISHHKESWHVAHGPFEDINARCIGAWSLLVQKVDQFIPDADELMRCFAFIPHWRMTDLMVSFSNAKAGVGPHIDQYDVFIIQGKGTRRWQIGLPGNYSESLPHADLKQISDFSPVIDEILQPGDIIYIPPHHPHNGVALEDCMNYSVGFRAPSQQELLTSFADYALEHNLFNKRYKDQSVELRPFPGEIKQQELQQFKRLLLESVNTPHFDHWLTQYLSETNRLSSNELNEEDKYSEAEISELLLSGVYFVREAGIKAMFTEQQSTENADFIFFVEGQMFSIAAEHKNFVLNFLNSPSFSLESQKKPEICLFFTQTLAKLVNSGFWFPE